jgi:hypothetical protein
MTVHRRVDFHAHQQTVCYCDTTDGAIRLAEPDHEADGARGFHSRLTRVEAILPEYPQEARESRLGRRGD